MLTTTGNITVYDQPNFGGRSKTFPLGEHRLFTPEDFKDAISSIQVPQGLVAILYEHADEGGGYGLSVDLLENCANLLQYNFNKITSYISVFAANRSGFVWIRASMQNGQFVAGHWERQRAHPLPPNPVAVVSPPLPPHTPTETIIQVNGPQSVITALAPQTPGEAMLWDHATADQMDIIGSDFRGVEEIGSAAFERGSNNRFIPDNMNFWYPQKEPRDPHDHRFVYFKRTLAGKVENTHIANIEGTYQDHDVNIDITPNDKYQNLLTNAHPREYTDIMSAQWNLSFHQSGQPNCDDSDSVAEFGFIEAEIQPNSDTHSATAQILNDRILGRGRQDICVYGPWIYDKGHCCHAEIHPAEQIWWRDDISSTEKRYTLSVFCDASKRFWWRDQMDDGTKLKPWGAPPITGLFAIAFEAEVGKDPLRYVVSNLDDYNVAVIPNGNQIYNLVYQNNTLVTFIPNNDAFKVTYENVGSIAGNKVRGFLVIETTVGTLTQKTTRIVIPSPSPTQLPTVVEVPQGTDVNKIDQRFERLAFEKVEGRYIFTVTTSSAATVKTLIDLNGRWESGGTPGPVVTVSGNLITIDMSAYHRPSAHGTIVGSSDITVTFPDDKTYTAKLQHPNTIRWSNNSTWKKALIDLNSRGDSGGTPGPVIRDHRHR
jgi:hypothetical protein